jgi:gliding motility-associated-like protein
MKIGVYSGIKVPGAFSPNGDGCNEVFYVLNGPEGSIIKEFLVFDRWGQNIFRVHNAPPGDPSFGWDGRFEGHVLDSATYVKAITVGAFHFVYSYNPHELVQCNQKAISQIPDICFVLI